MIVTIAAWLYILNAVLLLGSLLWSPGGFDGLAGLVTLAVASLLGAMGFGLLKRLPWARWLALGSSLLGWVLGSLLLLASVVYVLTVAPAALLAILFVGGIFSFIGVFVLFALLLWLATVVISYKLFWYLCSEPGCAEFGVPHESQQAVIASAGTWLGIFIVNFMVSGGGDAMRMMMPDDEADRAATAQSEAPALSPEEADYAARRARSEAMLRAQAELEAAHAAGVELPSAAEDEEEEEEEEAADEPGSAPQESYTIEESAVPVMEPASGTAEVSEEETTTRILKCVDASGGTIFTQGYCPPGSKPVRTPANP